MHSIAYLYVKALKKLVRKFKFPPPTPILKFLIHIRVQLINFMENRKFSIFYNPEEQCNSIQVEFKNLSLGKFIFMLNFNSKGL